MTMATDLLMAVEADEALLVWHAGDVVIPAFIAVRAWRGRGGFPEFLSDLACRRTRSQRLKPRFDGAIVSDALFEPRPHLRFEPRSLRFAIGWKSARTHA